MKDAYYFSHDSNARNDQRLMKVRMQYGMEGYGIYFAIIEILRETKDYKIKYSDIDAIAYELKVEQGIVDEIVFSYDLFEWEINPDGQSLLAGMPNCKMTDDDYFYSASLKRRMEKLDLIKQKRAEAGRVGGKSKASAKAKVKQLQASKVKESRVDKSKVNKNILNIEFEKFWDLYNYKVGSKSKVLKKWESLTELDRGMIMEHLPHYIKSTPDKQYRKHPATYLNNQGWFDEIVISQNGAIDFDLDGTGKFYKGYCDKCNEYASYRKEDLFGESNC